MVGKCDVGSHVAAEIAADSQHLAWSCDTVSNEKVSVQGNVSISCAFQEIEERGWRIIKSWRLLLPILTNDAMVGASVKEPTYMHISKGAIQTLQTV
nr:hypothetical protein [Tanacetum cinerariifolium]